MSSTPSGTLDPNTDWGSAAEREALAAPLRERARFALQSNDPRAAMVLAADALLLRPNAAESLTLVDGLLRASMDPLALAPLSVSVALSACRARALALQGDVLSAIALLRQVVKAAPTFACGSWLLDWLTPEVLRGLGLHELGGPIVAWVKLCSSFPSGLAAADPRLHNVRAVADLVARARHEYSDEAPLYSAEILLRRRLPDPGVTLAVATEAAARFADDWGALVSALGAERDARHPDAALAYARSALALLPTDGSPLHDAAWAYWEAQQPQMARALFDELLEEFPEYPLGDEARQILSR
jgi:tetratricopeptide (TPR) repeat protein